MKNIFIGFSFIVSIFLSGCAATTTALDHHKLATSTKMSESVFLDPSDSEEPAIYVSVKNTTDESGVENQVKQVVETRLIEKGYHLTKRASRADYMLQVNLLKIGKSNPDEARELLGSGFGGAVTGGVIGALASDSAGGLLAGGLVGGAVGMVADSLVKDVMYSLVTDIQISERPKAGQRVTTRSKSNIKQGLSTQQVVETSGGTDWIRYRARVISTAERMNLKFAQAEPLLVNELAQSVSGIF